MTAQEKFDTLIRDVLAPWLADAGFKKKDVTFRRRRGDAWQILNVQRSQWSDAKHINFTVNLGVTHPDLDDSPAWTKRGWPLEYQCDFRERLSQLKTGRDDWWSIKSSESTDATAKDVLAALEQLGLPWLDLHADPEAILREAGANPSQVGFMNLHAMHQLAVAQGAVEVAEAMAREIDLWQRQERPAPTP